MRKTPITRKAPLKAVSSKRAARQGGTKGYSTLAPSGKIKPKKRSEREFARIYGGHDRVAFVQSLPCVCCTRLGATQTTRSINAHIANGGMGRKASYAKIVPLCFECHAEQHSIGAGTFAIRYKLNLAQLAAATEAAWASYQEKGR